MLLSRHRPICPQTLVIADPVPNLFRSSSEYYTVESQFFSTETCCETLQSSQKSQDTSDHTLVSENTAFASKMSALAALFCFGKRIMLSSNMKEWLVWHRKRCESVASTAREMSTINLELEPHRDARAASGRRNDPEEEES
jgi:hypothetical protein